MRIDLGRRERAPLGRDRRTEKWREEEGREAEGWSMAMADPGKMERTQKWGARPSIVMEELQRKMEKEDENGDGDWREKGKLGSCVKWGWPESFFFAVTERVCFNPLNRFREREREREKDLGEMDKRDQRMRQKTQTPLLKTKLENQKTRLHFYLWVSSSIVA